MDGIMEAWMIPCIFCRNIKIAVCYMLSMSVLFRCDEIGVKIGVKISAYRTPLADKDFSFADFMTFLYQGFKPYSTTTIYKLQQTVCSLASWRLRRWLRNWTRLSPLVSKARVGSAAPNPE